MAFGLVGGDRYTQALGRYSTYYKQLTDAMGKATAAASKPISGDFNTLVNLYQPGGELDSANRTIVNDASKNASAEAMSSMVASGMSSGTNAIGAKARVKSDAAKLLAELTGNRIDNLGGALATRGTAQQQQIQQLIQALTQQAGMIGSFAGNEPNFQSMLDPSVGRTPAKDNSVRNSFMSGHASF